MAFYLHDHDDEYPDDFKQLFLSTWKAIESENVKKFSSSLDGMRAVSERYALGDRCVDVCMHQSVVSRHTRLRCSIYMSLLAYAGLQNQREMVDILIERKACTWFSSQITGSPMTQMMIYCLHHGCPERIDGKMIEYLINQIPENRLWEETDGVRQSNFDNNVVFHIPDRSTDWEICCPLELAIQMQRIDLAKQMVQAGANPVCADEALVEQILPLFIEFYEFGTNQYMSWLLHEHLAQDEIPNFIESVLEKKDMIFSEYAKESFKKEAGRHHVHAALTCGHEEMITKFIKRFPTDDGQKILKVKDCVDRTALQIASANGDLESVTTLLNLYTEWVDQEDGIDLAKALLAAARGNHLEVVEIILRMDDDAFHDKNRYSVLRVQLNGVETWKIAVQDGLSCIFEILRHYDQIIIAEKFDSDGNTLGHITAKSGNVNLFKVIFPLQKPLPLTLVKDSLKSKTNYSMFWALMLENKEKDTPLMVAIDNNHHNILESLQKRTFERELRQNARQNREKTEWKLFWEDHGKHLLLHASSCGSSRSLHSVKVLINITKSTLELLPGSWTEEAFQVSAKAGNDEVLYYFLQQFQTFISQEMKNKALLVSADYGHHRCIRVLLKNGADIKAKDENDGNNCLIKAIEKKHREAVLTILSDEEFGPESLRFVRRETRWLVWNRLQLNEYTQPLVLLVIYMPEIAEWVLNKCALSKPPSQFESDSVQPRNVVIIDENATPDNQDGMEQTDFGGELERLPSAEEEKGRKVRDYVMENKFEFLDLPASIKVADQTDSCDVHERSRRFKTINNSIHPIQAMINFDRTAMLNHNLVQSWIDHKLKDVVLDLVLYLILYLLFLTTLTLFALLLPRPGPLNDYCHFNQTLTRNASNVNETFLDIGTGFGMCEGQSRHLRNFFYVCAVVLLLSSLWYLVLEGVQFYHRLHQYIVEVENYVQVLMFICVVIFAFPVGQNNCWCFPEWKWQIGALAVFLVWLNLLLLIRYIPWLKIGQHSTMLFNIYVNFVVVIYLPIITVLTFGIPLYMLLVNVTANEGTESSNALAVFVTPFTTLYNIVFQTAGEVDGNNIIQSPLHYEAATYVLLLVFVIAVPILFNNFLTGMAVGEIQEERNKAYKSLTKRKIYYIFEVQNVLYRKVIPYITRKCCKRMIRKMELNVNVEKLREFRANDKAIKDDIKSKTRAKSTKRRVKRLALLMTQNETTLNTHKVELEQSLQTLGAEVADIKESMTTMKQMIHQLSVAISHKEKETEL